MPLALRRQTDQQFGHPVIAVVDQQALLGLSRQHPLGQHHLRFAFGPQCRRQRIVQSQFHHHRHADLRERRPPPPTPRLAHLLFVLGRVGDRKQTAIHSAQTQPLIKRFRMSGRLALGLKRRVHHLFEHRHGQPRPALGQGPVGNRLAGELFHMLRQCASLRHHMEDQALDQFPRTDHGGQRRRTPQRRSRA